MKKDILSEKILRSKTIYWVLLLILLAYLINDDKILNYPKWYSISKWGGALLTAGIFTILRISKYREYYKKNLRQTSFLISFILTIALSSFFISLLINTPVSYYLKSVAKHNPIEYKLCPIKNFVAKSQDQITFSFEGKTYTRYKQTQDIERNEVLRNYSLEIGVRKAAWGTYSLETMQLVRNSQ